MQFTDLQGARERNFAVAKSCDERSKADACTGGGGNARHFDSRSWQLLDITCDDYVSYKRKVTCERPDVIGTCAQSSVAALQRIVPPLNHLVNQGASKLSKKQKKKLAAAAAKEAQRFEEDQRLGFFLWSRFA